jgi:hypothetical protein
MCRRRCELPGPRRRDASQRICVHYAHTVHVVQPIRTFPAFFSRRVLAPTASSGSRTAAPHYPPSRPTNTARHENTNANAHPRHSALILALYDTRAHGACNCGFGRRYASIRTTHDGACAAAACERRSVSSGPDMEQSWSRTRGEMK